MFASVPTTPMDIFAFVMQYGMMGVMLYWFAMRMEKRFEAYVEITRQLVASNHDLVSSVKDLVTEVRDLKR